MASNPSSNQPFVVNFDNSSRDNFLSWKRSIDSTLSRHPNNLLTIVQDWELATSVRVRIKKDAKALGEEPNADYLLAFVHEFDTAAYYIIIASVSNRTVLQEMERRFGEKTEGKKAYEHICRLWELNGDDADERFTGKDQERKDLVNAGPQSGSNEHVSKFVEDLIAINNELADTDWHWSDTILTTTLLSALSKIMPHYVDGFRGQHAGKTGWKSDFDKVWKAIKTHLDTKEIEASRERGPANTEILASNSAPDPRDARIDALTEQVAILATMLTKRGRTSERPNVGKCPDCNHPHKPDDTFGCIGKAVHEKKITLADAARKFTNRQRSLSKSPRTRRGSSRSPPSATRPTTTSRTPSRPASRSPSSTACASPPPRRPWRPPCSVTSTSRPCRTPNPGTSTLMTQRHESLSRRAIRRGRKT